MAGIQAVFIRWLGMGLLIVTELLRILFKERMATITLHNSSRNTLEMIQIGNIKQLISARAVEATKARTLSLNNLPMRWA